MISETLVVLPTYDELENLERVVSAVRPLGHDVLIVDDNSPDGTGRLADRLAAADPGVTVLHRPRKLGLGSAYVAGFTEGLERGYQLFVEMDADRSHLPEHLDPIVAAARRSGGLAIGSRYVRGGGIGGWVPVRDCTSGYRCYTRRALEAIGLHRILSQGYSFQIEMLYRCRRLGFAVVEVPIRFEDRTHGRSKVSEGEIRKALINVVRMRFARWP